MLTTFLWSWVTSWPRHEFHARVQFILLSTWNSGSVLHGDHSAGHRYKRIRTEFTKSNRNKTLVCSFYSISKESFAFEPGTDTILPSTRAVQMNRRFTSSSYQQCHTLKCVCMCSFDEFHSFCLWNDAKSRNSKRVVLLRWKEPQSFYARLISQNMCWLGFSIQEKHYDLRFHCFLLVPIPTTSTYIYSLSSHSNWGCQIALVRFTKVHSLCLWRVHKCISALKKGVRMLWGQFHY